MKEISLKKTRGCLACILVLALVAVNIYAEGYFARAADNPKIYADEMNASAGDEIKIPVKISGNTGLMGMGVKVSYDKNVLTLQNVSMGKILSGVFDYKEQETGDAFDAMWAGADEVSQDGEVFVMAFQVASGIKSQNTELTISYLQDDTFDGDYKDVALDCQKVSIAIGNTAASTEPPVTNPPISTGEQPAASATGLPSAVVLDDFDIYIGYANTEWTESFFIDKARSTKITGDGFYSVSFTAESSTEDIQVLTLDTQMNKPDVSDALKIVPETLNVGNVCYSLGSCDVAGDENGYYRIDIRNPYDEVFATNQALGKTLVPVHAGDIVRIGFTVAGMGKINPEATGQPVSLDTADSPDSPSQPEASASAMPSVPSSSSAATQKPETPDKVRKPSKPGRVKITVCKSKQKKCLRLKWKDVPESRGYQIQYARKRSFAGKRAVNVYGKSSVLYGLKSKKIYYIRIRAYKSGNSANNYKRVYGKWSKIKKVRVK